MIRGNWKKLMAGLLAAAMLVTSAPVPASAAGAVTGTTAENPADITGEEAPEEQAAEEKSTEEDSVSDSVQTGAEEGQTASGAEESSESGESESQTEQAESRTETAPPAEEGTGTSESSTEMTETETATEDTAAEESTEDVTEESGTELETEEETAEDGIALNASGNGVAEKLNSVLSNYPAGKYWNNINGHAGVNDTACPTHKDAYGNYIVSPTCIKFSDRYHGDSSVGQCWGFANMIYSTVFGELPDWKDGKRTNKDEIRVGDYVRFGDNGIYGHSFIVVGKGEGHNVNIVECNWGGNCIINYRSMNLDDSFYFGGANRYFSYYCRASNWDEINNPPPSFDRVKGEYMQTGYYRTIPDGYYHIASSFGDKWWLTIAGMSNDNGANVELYDYSIRDFECDEQLFYFQFIDESGGRGFYKITNKKSGKCLDVAGASEYMYDENGNPTNIQQYEDNGGANQQWAVRQINGGDKGILYTFKARCSGFCLDLWLGEDSLYNGANISMCKDNGSLAQQWRLIPYAPSIGKTIEDGEYQIVYHAAENKAVGAVGSDIGANVELSSSYKGDYKQTFNVKYLGNGYYSIVNKYSGLLLDVAGAYRMLGTNVWLWEDILYDAQKWIIKPCGDGSYNIISKCNGLYLDLENGDTKDGNNISMWHWNVGSANQKWKFVPYEKPKMEPPTAPYPDGADVAAGTRFYLDGHGADEIYFTWDGTTPTKQSMQYSSYKLSGLAIFSQWKSYTLKAFAVKEGYQDSDIVTYTYTVIPEPSEEESSSDEESSSAEESSSDEESSSAEESSSGEESSSAEESSSNEESSSTEESGAAGDDDIEEGVKWHYNEQKVTYKDLSQSGARITTNIKPKVYDGTSYKPSIKVTAVENGKTVTLTEGTDYRVAYTNNVHAGTGTVTVRGNGVYTGAVSKNFEIKKKPIKKLKIVTGGMTVGGTSEPRVYVYDGSALLKQGKDYMLEGIGAELAVTKGSKKIYVVAAASSDYEGSAAAKITVYATNGSRVKGIISSPDSIKLSQSTYAYTAKACKPAMTVTVDGNTLKANKDYSVKYQNNTNVGTAFVTITGKSGYVGSVVKEFVIKPNTGAGSGFALKKPIKDAVYNGRLQKPQVAITSGGRTLKLNRDYTVTYSNNLHATGSAKATVRGKGNYAGIPAAVFQFNITLRHINKVTVKGKQDSLVLTYANHTLVKGVDYDITYGTASKGRIPVTIKAKEGSSFMGEVTKRISAKKVKQ